MEYGIKKCLTLKTVAELQKNIVESVRTGKSLLGKDGALTPLIKHALEAALEGEIEAHMAADDDSSNNRRNGKMKKLVNSESGPFELETPRDRNGSFEPQIVKKRQTVITEELDHKILALYSLGVGYQDISKQMLEMYGYEVSPATITSVTDKLLPAITEWRSRDSFYRFKQLYETGGEEALQDLSRKKPNLKNRVPQYIEEPVIAFATEFPAYGQLRASNELNKRGILVSSSGLRSVWVRYDLETLKKRLKALEAKVAQDGIILTESQLQALEKAKAEKEAHGEIESEHPGYLGAQDTYYVGTIKGIGRIYQQTFIDTYSRVAFAKLYTEKTAITAADTLNDMVLPWFEQQEVPLLRMHNV